MSNAVRGTLSWMSPEALRGEKYSRKGDIWALGACIIEMAVAGDPWQGLFTSAVEAMMRIPNEDINMKVPSVLSAYAKDFVGLCLRRDKEERPTAHQLAEHPWVRQVFKRFYILK